MIWNKTGKAWAGHENQKLVRLIPGECLAYGINTVA